MWENLNIGKFSRFLRILLVAIITIILIAGTFYVTIISKEEEKKLREFTPSINCERPITKTEAYLD